MRYTASEKKEIIDIVSASEIGVERTLEELGIAKSNFYRWYGAYHEYGFDGLLPKSHNRNQFWNKIPAKERERIVEFALEYEDLSPRELATKYTDEKKRFISESSVYRILKSRGVKHIHGQPLHPQTQGKIERWHRSMKNVVKLEHYYFPEELKRASAEYIEYYNTQRYHESLENLTPEAVYRGFGERILNERKLIKESTMRERKRRNDAA